MTVKIRGHTHGRKIKDSAYKCMDKMDKIAQVGRAQAVEIDGVTLGVEQD